MKTFINKFFVVIYIKYKTIPYFMFYSPDTCYNVSYVIISE